MFRSVFRCVSMYTGVLTAVLRGVEVHRSIFRPVKVCRSVYRWVQVCPGVFRFISHPHNFGVTAGTGGGKELLVAVFAVDAVLLLHKADVSQRGMAVVAVELLRVPRATQCHQKGTPGKQSE